MSRVQDPPSPPPSPCPLTDDADDTAIVTPATVTIDGAPIEGEVAHG